MADIRHWGLLVGGVWLEGSDRIDVRNAFDDALVGTVVKGTEADVDDAITAANSSLN